MNAKKYIVAAIAINTVVLAFAACLYHCRANDVAGKPLSGPSGRFGPVVEFVLPAAKTNGTAEIRDLETGRTLVQPSFEDSDSPGQAIMAWIRTNGLDISCSVWPKLATCVTYEMTVVAVESEDWKETTEEDLLGNAALAPKMHSPRRQLVLGLNRPDTYLFRTGEGTLGILRLVGLTENRQGVKIQYKLVKPKNDNQTSTRTIGNLLTAH